QEDEIVTLTSFSSLDKLPISATLDFLSSKIDMTNCLSNCSNQGKCNITNGFAFCNCRKYFIGDKCEKDLRKCSSNPCFNGGSCVEMFELNKYECLCDEMFYGKNCEFKIDVCENETCSKHGYCKDFQSKPKCICDYLFSGDKCEIESGEIKAIKKTVTSASAVAIVCLVLFYSIFIIFDAIKFSSNILEIIKLLIKK
ncbi:unnamed protein product, partial [Brachionus calyciflorus]